MSNIERREPDANENPYRRRQAMTTNVEREALRDRPAHGGRVMTRAEAMELFTAIAHGDQEHREWLREALRNFADGKPVPPPRGKGTDEHAVAPAQEAVAWFNYCDKTVPEALRFLASNDRPSGGEQRFNSAHLHQLAGEIEHMSRKPLYAAPQPPATGGDAVDMVARAIYLAMHGDKGGRWECVEPRYQEQVWGAYAKAAIAALANHSPDAGGVGEREAVVAWLREQAKVANQKFLKTDEGTNEARNLAAGYVAITRAAESIESGEHRPGLRAGETKPLADSETKANPVVGSGEGAGEPQLPDDVRALVIAGREFLDEQGWMQGDGAGDALDKALEAFSSRVPYDDEPTTAEGGE